MTTRAQRIRRASIVLMLGTLLMTTRSAWAIDLEQFSISGYGNVHSMDHSGLPELVGRDDPNDLFFQLREFTLFMDFDITEGVIASMEMEAGLCHFKTRASGLNNPG